MTTRHCSNPGCYLHGHKVDTDITECLACGNDLQDTPDWINRLFGDLVNGDVADLFKRQDKP